MDNKRKKEMLEMAKEAIEAGIDVIDYVTLKDGKRGEFFGRVTEYLKDALKAPNCLAGYIDDVDRELISVGPDPDALITSWENVSIPEGCRPVKTGETMWANDLILVGGVWNTMSVHFGKKARAMIGLVYPHEKFLLCRKDYSNKAVADEVPLIAGYSKLEPDDHIRFSDFVLTQKGTWAEISSMSEDVRKKSGMKFKDAALHSVIRRKPINPSPKVGESQTPLIGFRKLGEGEVILASDMIFMPERKCWTAVSSPQTVEEIGNLTGILYLEKFGTITRFREEADKTVVIQEPLLPETQKPRLLM